MTLPSGSLIIDDRMATAAAENGLHESETQQPGVTTYDQPKTRPTLKINSFSSAYNNSDAIVIIRAFAIVIGLVGALLNGLVLWVLFSRRSRSSQKFTLLFVNQVVLDFSSCVALVVTYAVKIPAFAYRNDDGWSNFFCFFFYTEFTICYFEQGSVCNLVLIAVERNVFIVHQVTYKRYFRKWMAYAGAALSWVLPIGYDAQIFFTTKLVDGECVPGYAYPSDTFVVAFTFCSFVSIMVVPLLTLIVCYGGILYFVRRHKKVMHANQVRHRAAAGSNPVQRKSRRQEMELVVTMLLISTMYFVSWTPNQVWLLAQFVKFQIENTKVLFTASILFVYLGACFNPFIYVSKQESIRKGVLDILRKVRPKSGAQGTKSTTEAIQTISFTA